LSGGGRSPAAAQPQAAATPAATARSAVPVPTAVTKASVKADLPANLVDPNQSRASPMIVDNSDSGTAPPKLAGAAGAPAGGQQPAQPLSAEEQFAQRVGGEGARTHAQDIGDPSSTVVQGTMIPAVLETALNSDLPGYARALVSRDVRSFDGSKVAIPRGSRLIGQYKSGLSSGQSRAFIVWSRLIRPD